MILQITRSKFGYLHLYNNYLDFMMHYRVILDETIIGTIQIGEKKEFNISNGSHVLMLACGRCHSNIIAFEANEHLVEFECGNNSNWSGLFLLNYIFFPETCLWLNKIVSADDINKRKEYTYTASF